MKPLKRPMFRSGGPIKEGIMDGMQNRPQQLVQPAADGGRPGYAGPLAFLGLNALRTGAMRMAPRAIQGIKNFFTTPVTKTVPKQGPSFQVPGGNVYSKGFPGGKVSSKTVGPGSAEITTRQLKPYFANDPLIATGGKIIQGLTSPTSKGLIQKGARVVFSPTGVATGLIYAGGKFFDSDGNEIDKKTADEAGLYAGDKTIDEQTTTPDSGDPKSTKLNRDEEIEANRKRYYKLMGIDKMQKGAAYDSLIDASNIIREEGGDLKGAIKSGSLQSQIINAISKNLDKSTDLKKQIDAAILKGEIEKDIKSADTMDKRLKEAQIKRLERDEKQNTTAAKIAAVQIEKGAVTAADTAAILRSDGVEYTGALPDDEFLKFKKKNKGKDERDFLIENYGALDDGKYIIGGRLVEKRGDNVAFAI